MSRQIVDEIIAEIRKEAVDDETVRQAARRVFSKVFDAAYLPERVEKIRGCQDFQALMSAYLNGTLRSARRSLLEDHVGTCVDCRRMLTRMRTGDPERTLSPAEPGRLNTKRRVRLFPLALAASLAIGICVGVTGAFKGLLPGQHAVRATVVSVEGTLYRVSDYGSTLVKVGSVIRNAEELRTAKGSRAIFQLLGGGQIEMGERSDVSVSGGWSGSSVDVERGHVIVEGPEQNQKSFTVAAGDVSIPAKGAIFSVNRGVKGSRIAVARGKAEVRVPQNTVVLNAGQQTSTDYRLQNVSLASEFAWSSNADRYRALLSEFAVLQKQIQNIQAPGLRYSADLAKYLPESLVAYAAIPNLGGTLTEAKRIFDDRLAESAVLRDWWQAQGASRGGQLDRAVAQIGSISRFLGDEIVLAIPSGTDEMSAPVFLAAIREPGLREYLLQNVNAGVGLQLLDGSRPIASASHALFVSLDNNVIVASPDARALRGIVTAVAGTAPGRFTTTPFYRQILESYRSGAGYLLVVDMEQIISRSVHTRQELPPGMSNARYLVLEKKDVAGKSEMRATLSFAGAREGIASWLGAPGPMGSLDFVSPDASFAASTVMKNPRAVVQELIAYASRTDSNFAGHLSEMQTAFGVNLVDDVAAPLGSDISFAVDGPLLPLPAWVLAVEVYDPARLQNTIQALVEHLNAQSSPNAIKLSLDSRQVDSRTFHALHNNRTSDIAMYYTFVDGYLVAGSSEANVLQAIQNRQSGHTLASSPNFTSELPDDSYTNFSSIIYHNAGRLTGPVADQLKGSAALSNEQRKSMAAILANTAPGLICLYGEPDRIVAASRSSFLNFNLGTFTGMAQGPSLVPLIASSAMAFRPESNGPRQQRSQ